MILCRDLFIHFSFDDIKKTVENIKKSNSKYLLTNTFPSVNRNKDIKTGTHHYINLLLSPFFFPEPIKLIKEIPQKSEIIKKLGLWEIKNLP